MKDESLIDELKEYLGLNLRDLAEFFMISRQMLGYSKNGDRLFPSRQSDKRFALFRLLDRMKAEAAPFALENLSASPAYREKRKKEVERRLALLTRTLEKEEKRTATARRALLYYEQMRTEIPGLTELDLAWIQKQYNKALLNAIPHTRRDAWVWEYRSLQEERQALLQSPTS